MASWHPELLPGLVRKQGGRHLHRQGHSRDPAGAERRGRFLEYPVTRSCRAGGWIFIVSPPGAMSCKGCSSQTGSPRRELRGPGWVSARTQKGNFLRAEVLTASLQPDPGFKGDLALGDKLGLGLVVSPLSVPSPPSRHSRARATRDSQSPQAGPCPRAAESPGNQLQLSACPRCRRAGSRARTARGSHGDRVLWLQLLISCGQPRRAGLSLQIACDQETAAQHFACPRKAVQKPG